ncbi:MAG: HEAT repeat domain-containing protein, partial [Phycisphaerae bacterium]|nr:HEAT repeat domain-containing protein [Phycisphaerae bacterium]
VAVNEALEMLRARGVVIEADATAATAFERLAELYYGDHRSLAADTRLETANIWYWRDNILQDVPIPTEIFNEVMCMRMCEKALHLVPDHKPALALWLAANLRREAQLGEGEDKTRSGNFPTGIYFAQSAGAEYCQMVLSRAVRDGDPAVALGAITALRKTAGPANLFPGLDRMPPLAAALSFPDRMVRIQAGLALAYARPREPFHGSQNLLPVLSETLSLHAGARDALVIDPYADSSNPVAGVLREAGYAVIVESSLLVGLDKARNESPGTDVIFLASDIKDPGLEAGLETLRKEFRFAATPVVVIAKDAERTLVRDLVRGDHRLGEIESGDAPEQILVAVAKVSAAVGAEPITPERGVALAKEATEALRLFAISHNAIFDLAAAEPALLKAMSTEDAELRIAVAHVLGYLPSAKAQATMAELAFNEETDEAMRVAMFGALAEAAKHQGNLLEAGPVETLIKIAESDANMLIRTAASQALGALNLPGNPASQIIRNLYQG